MENVFVGRYKIKSLLFGSLYAFLEYPERIPPSCQSTKQCKTQNQNRNLIKVYNTVSHTGPRYILVQADILRIFMMSSGVTGCIKGFASNVDSVSIRKGSFASLEETIGIHIFGMSCSIRKSGSKHVTQMSAGVSPGKVFSATSYFCAIMRLQILEI